MPNEEHIVVIDQDGSINFIYSDSLADLQECGEATTKRASDVEPSSGGWTADMARSGGGTLGPFPLRCEALAAEVDWLQEQMVR